MFVQHKPEHRDKKGVINRHYMTILNSIPDAVYWTDVHCNLIGCNNKFIHLMGIKKHSELKGTPYLLMKEYAHWQEQRVDAFKLDDMKTIFSETPSYDIDEQSIINDKNKTLYFKSNRVPMFDEQQKICGLVVVLSDVTPFKQKDDLKERNENQELISVFSSLEQHGQPKVLMIEDNPIAQHIEHALLKSLNCAVDVADTGDRAMQLFAPGKYDLVLMDIGLADTSGYVVAKQLRTKEKDSQYHVPIIALTGYEADVVKHDCRQYFMEGVITKPLTSEQAEQMIKRYVHNIEVEVHGLKSS